MSVAHTSITRVELSGDVTPRIARALGHLGHVAEIVWRSMSSRDDLLSLDDRMLSDLGISRAQAQFEASRPIWHIRSTRR